MDSKEGISLTWLFVLAALTLLVAVMTTRIFGIFGGIGVVAGVIYLVWPSKSKK